MRVRKEGLKGLEASTIGLTLVGYIAAGFFIGQWLDGHFKTAFWMPLLVLIGTGAGFRDIIRLVTAMGKRAEATREDRAVMRQESKATTPSIPEAEGESRPKPRFFEVPAPPRASFDKDNGDQSSPAKAVARSSTPVEPPALADDETAIEKLLADAKLDGPSDKQD